MSSTQQSPLLLGRNKENHCPSTAFTKKLYTSRSSLSCSTLTQKIRNRKLVYKPQQISQVVHKYILGKLRDSKSKPLSQELFEKIEKTRQILNVEKERLAYSRQMQSKLKSKIEKKIELISKSRVLLEQLKNHKEKPNPLKTFMVQRSNMLIRRKSTICEKERLSLGKEMNQQIKIKNKLFYKIIMLQHVNASLEMKNQIIGDRLKGIFYSSHSNKGIPLSSEISKMSTVLSTMEDKHQAGLKKFLYLKDFATVTFSTEDIEIHRRKIMEDTQKIKIYFFDKMELLKGKIFKAGIESQKRMKVFEGSQNRYKHLVLAFLKQKSRLQALKAKKNEDEVFTCINCGDLYIESNNNAWACRTHTSSWIQNEYWCCGKTDFNSPGCTKCSHISKEEELDFSDFKTSKFCVSCLKYGHLSKECPDDPNVRTGVFDNDEIGRIRMLSQKKYNAIVGISNRDVEEYEDWKELMEIKSEVKYILHTF